MKRHIISLAASAFCALALSSHSGAEGPTEAWPLQASDERGCCVVTLPTGETRCQFTHARYCEQIANGAPFDFRPGTACRAIPQCRPQRTPFL